MIETVAIGLGVKFDRPLPLDPFEEPVSYKVQMACWGGKRRKAVKRDEG